MQFKTYILTLLLLIISEAVLANSDIYVASTKDSEFKFNKREKIILALPKYPTELEKSFVGDVRKELTKQNFILVDSVQNAERILTFRIAQDVNMNFEVTSPKLIQDDIKVGEIKNTSTSSVDSGYTILQMSMQDIGLLKEGSKRSTIWQCSVSTKNENFDDYPELVLEQLVKLYGKNKVDEEKIKKPKKSKKN